VLIFRRVVAILLVLIAAPYLVAPVYRFPRQQPFAGPKLWNPYAQLSGTWQKANLHAHGYAWSGFTNGRQADEDVVRAYKQQGYAVAGVSDYASIAAFHGVDTLPLYEHGYNIAKAHQLVIGARRIEWFDFPLWQGVQQKQYITERLGGAGVLVAVAHPNTAYVDSDFRNLTGYQLIEVVNGRNPSEDLWDAALSAGRVVWAVANDDSHDVTNLRRTFIAWNMIDASSAATAPIVEALRQGRSYAVALVGEQVDAALKSVTVCDGTLAVASTGVPATYVFVGQDGAVRHSANQVMEASYTFAARDTYIRTVIRTPNIVMFVNPIIRYEGLKLPQPVAVVDEAATWERRGIVFVIVGGIAVLLWRRRRDSRQ
jgi:hypothetical protein